MPSGRYTTPLNMFVDNSDGLWVGTLERGLLRINQGRTGVFGEVEGLSGDHVTAIFQDRENNVWVGTTEGLDRFLESAVASITVKQGLSSPSVWAVVAASDNSAWITTLDGVDRWKNGQITIYRSVKSGSPRGRAVGHASPVFAPSGVDSAVTEKTDPGLPDDRVGSLYEDDRRRIWISTPGGIARFEGGRFTEVKELPAGWVNAITGDNHEGVWISYQDLGLVHWIDGKVVERIPWSSLGGGVIASSVLPDPGRGGLWVGFFEGGLVFLKDGAVRADHGTRNGLGAGRVMGLELDRDGALWAATEGGLSRVKDGRITTLTTANGLPCETVHWSVEVEDSFWIYTACGLLRVASAEMEKWSADPTITIRFTTFDSSDGVRSRALLSGYTPRVSKSADGKLWFATLASVGVLDPHDLRLNTQPPPVQIERIIADDKPYDAKNGLRLSPRIHYLAIDYTALSLTNPEKVRFRYKLEGEDKDWREVVNDREVQYSNLAPKHYRFRVLAANNSGVWNEEGAALDFVIPPMWYQTNWFRAACLAAFALLLWALYRLRVRQLAYQFNMRLEERVSERTRIARDLHDTLLQSFQALLPRLQAAIYKLPESAVEARKTLEVAVDQASEAIAEGRDAVQGLRASTVEQNDLALAIRTVGEELASADHNQSSPEFNVVVEGTSRNLHPILRDEVYRLAAEALRNAFRHAAARKVEVEIRYDERHFRLRVRDDGKGIGDEVLRAEEREGHYGLPGMKERAGLVGGKLTIWSEVDNGTEIELVIPASRAYAQPTRRLWKFGKRSAEDVNAKETINRE
jgi:signal transduction histidine kinase